MRVVRHGDGLPVRMDSAVTTDAGDAAFRAKCAAEGRRAWATSDALAAALAAPAPRATPRLDSKSARAAFVKSTEAAWKTPTAGATRRQ